MTGDTIFALSSGRPPAAIGIVRISGPLAHEAGRLIAGALPDARNASVRDFRHPQTHDLLDRGILLRFDAPSSATGEDSVELHIHGGRAVADAILDALTSIDGLRLARPGEFTRRAFEGGRLDLTEAEGLADLLQAETQSQRKAALALAGGGLGRQVEQWQAELLGLSARAELAIDYSEDDTQDQDKQLSRDCAAFALELRQWLGRPRMEMLRDGVRVVIAGPPNAGKSSLINAITGSDRAIVTELPGTTRDHIDVPIALGDIPLLLTDTAGLRATDDPVERIGVARSETLVTQADVLVWLGNPREAPDHPRLIRVHAQADRAERTQVPADSLPVSAVTGAGLGSLLEEVASLARTLIPAEDAIALNRRQAELVESAATSAEAAASSVDPVVIAEELRVARGAFDRLTGRAGVEDMLDALFGRFCLGK